MAYREYPFINGRPFVPITLENPTTHVTVAALAWLDSGADGCLFPQSICRQLGYDLKTGVPATGTAAGEQALRTWAHPVIIHLMHPDAPKRSIRLLSMPSCDVAFTEQENGNLLLGASNFMYRFATVTLLYSKQILRLADGKH